VGEEHQFGSVEHSIPDEGCERFRSSFIEWIPAGEEEHIIVIFMLQVSTSIQQVGMADR